MQPLPLLLLWLLLAPDPVRSGEPAVPPHQEEQDRAAEEPFRRMLLHLADGRVLRVRARAQDDGFEVRASSKSTYHVPAGAVTRAADEVEVLREARRLAKSVRRDEPVRRVALAAWMFDQGLWEEGIDELDPLLGAEPDQPEALELLQRHPPPLALPALEPDEVSVRAFLGQVAGAKPVAREVAVARLGALAERDDLPEPIDLASILRDELEASSVRRRSLAAHALRRAFPGHEAEPLLRRAVLDGSEDVRVEAARALAAAEEPALCLPVIRALGSSSSAVRANAAEALGNMGYPHAVEPLVSHLGAVHAVAQSGGGYHPPAAHIFVGKQMAYVQDYDVEVAQGTAIAKPVINILTEGAVLDVRVLAVSQTQIVQEKAVVRRALGKLTGADPGGTTAAWQGWWDRHGPGWMARLGPPDPSAPTRSPGR